MATDMMKISASTTTFLKDLYVKGVLNCKSTVNKSSSDLTSLFAAMGHSHETVAKGTNGYSIKFEDGTLICWFSYDQTTISDTNSWYGIWGGDNAAYHDFTFPVAFKSTPVVVGNLESDVYSVFQVSSITTTACRVRQWVTYSTKVNLKYSYLAIGKWK